MTKYRFQDFGTRERRQLADALRVAIDVYEKDRQVMCTTPGHERLAMEFLDQRDECQSLLDELESRQ